MPRIRTIKPEFFDSPGTASASYETRLFFIALWCWADDYGIGTANPKQLIGFAFPNDPVTDAEFPRLRTEVATAFGVQWYEVDGRPYFAIPSWDKHQKNERRANRRNPGPEQAADQGLYGTSEESRGTSVRTDGGSPLGTGEQGNRGTGEENTCASTVVERERAPDTIGDDFEIWYLNYPRKKGKGQALKAYRAARKKADHGTLVAAVHAQKPQLMARGAEFCPHPATWLNGERWLDQPDTTAATKSRYQQETDDLFDRAAQRMGVTQ